MNEHAEFYIEKVRYNKDRTRAVWFSCRQDVDGKLQAAQSVSRRQVVRLMHEGKRFMTILRNPEGKFRKGKVLAMFRTVKSEYLRTDQEKVEQDHLVDIPEY